MIAWAEIEAECGNYRDGFVNVFRRYEGQATDEKDGSGRTVKVTASSFARHMGIPESTFKRWVRVRAAAAPTSDQRERGDREVRGARAILRDAPMEQVEKLISDLPPERQQKIAAAAGNEYMRARVGEQERVAGRTPQEQQEIDRAKERLTRPVRQAVGQMSALGIADLLEEAAEKLHELASDQSLTPDAMRAIERANVRWNEAYRFAMALSGLEVDDA